jgi:predicted dehydrogenase
MTRLKVQKAEPLRLEYEDVLDAISHDRAPKVSGEDGIAVLKVVIQLSEATQQCDKQAVNQQKAHVLTEAQA